MNTGSLLFVGALLAAPAYAQCGTPDVFEDNDDCAGAVALPGGAATNLNVEDVDRDFFSVTVNAGERLTVDATFIDLNGDIDLYLFDPLIACDTAIGGEFAASGAVDYSTSITDMEQVTYDNTSAAPVDLIFEVRLWSGSPALCNEYDISYTLGPVPPLPCANTPDVFEPNVDCATAVPLGDGAYNGLDVEELDNDYYAVTLQDGGTLDVDIFFIDDDGDVDLLLWDPSIDCNFAAGGALGSALVTSRSVTDNEAVSYTNTSGGPLDLIIEIDMWTAGACNDYDMTISGAMPSGPGPIGSSYCTAQTNTTGVAASIAAEGLTSAAANDLTLTASDMPAFQFGIFLTSETQAATPVASGTLCLGGNLIRFQGPGQILQADSNGEFSLAIDTQALPAGVPTPIMPGETWNFTAWFRDTSPMGPSANFTNGVSIDFN